jgi:hypothetical protein
MTALAVQPLWKGATDETSAEIGENLCGAMLEAGFQKCRIEQRRLWPRMIVCVIGHGHALGPAPLEDAFPFEN